MEQETDGNVGVASDVQSWNMCDRTAGISGHPCHSIPSLSDQRNDEWYYEVCLRIKAGSNETEYCYRFAAFVDYSRNWQGQLPVRSNQSAGTAGLPLGKGQVTVRVGRLGGIRGWCRPRCIGPPSLKLLSLRGFLRTPYTQNHLLAIPSDIT